MPALNNNTSREGLDRSARFWGGLVDTPEQRAAKTAATRAAIYMENPYHGLFSGQYQKARRSKWDQSGTTPNESDIAYTERIRSWLPRLEVHLPADEFQRILAQYQAAVQRIGSEQQTHDQVRDGIQNRVSGHNVGLFGVDRLRENRGMSPMNTSGVPASSAEIYALVRQREEQRRG
jgi:hypothetical protein